MLLLSLYCWSPATQTSQGWVPCCCPNSSVTAKRWHCKAKSLPLRAMVRRTPGWYDPRMDEAKRLEDCGFRVAIACAVEPNSNGKAHNIVESTGNRVDRCSQFKLQWQTEPAKAKKCRPPSRERRPSWRVDGGAGLMRQAAQKRRPSPSIHCPTKKKS